MLDTVVVVATHLGENYLKKSLPLMTRWPVVVVDTGAMSPAVVDLCDAFDNVTHLQTPYKGYDTGAYLWAYWNIPAKKYLFMQDSCAPRDADFVEQFAAKMPGEIGAVGWSSFSMEIWDSTEQRDATAWMYGAPGRWPRKGIFGPIFYTTRSTLFHLYVHGLLPMPPVHKAQQQAMERAWAMCFHRAGVLVNFLRDEECPDGGAMARGEYPALVKTFPVRA